MNLDIKSCSNVIPFTYTGIDGSRSLIDHFILSSNYLSNICDYFTHDSVDNLSDLVLLFITCKLDCNDLIIIDEPTVHVPKPKWKFTNKDHIHHYHVELERRLTCLFKMSSELINCKHCTSTNDHESQITDFHDRLVLAVRESRAVDIPHSIDSIKTKVIPGWDAECDLAREQSRIWLCIWKQCDKPGGEYTRYKYHYLLKYFEKRVNTYNSTPVVDGIHSGTDIATHLKNKFNTNTYGNCEICSRAIREQICNWKGRMEDNDC